MDNPTPNFQDFAAEWTGKAVDYNHVFRTEAIDLVLQYLYECHRLSAPYTTPLDFWVNTNSSVLDNFAKLGGSDIGTGDIVVLENPEHIVLTTGNQNDLAFEALEQNGETGDASTQSGDSVRTRYIAKERIVGLLRAKSDKPVTEPSPVTEVAPEPKAPPAPPAAPVPVTLAETYELVATVPTYPTPMDASEKLHARSNGTLGAGTYYVFADGDGIKNISIDNQHEGFWVNVSENVEVLEPKVDPEEALREARRSEKERMVANRGNHLGNPAVTAAAPVEPEPEETFTWKDSYVPYSEPRHFVANIAYPATNIDPDGQPVSIMVNPGTDVTVYGHFFREGVKFYRLHAKSDVDYVLWVAVPAVHKERAVLVKPAPSWAERIFHRYQQTLTTIFPVKVDGEDRYIDSVKLEPFKKPTKWRAKK